MVLQVSPVSYCIRIYQMKQEVDQSIILSSEELEYIRWVIERIDYVHQVQFFI